MSPSIAFFATLAPWIAALGPAQEAFPGIAQEAPDERAPGFSVPDTRAARELADSADAHLRAGRWADAIRDLQELIERHQGAVLGAERPEHADRPSQRPVHRGAARRARELLLALPSEGRRVYRERFGEEARLALERARARADRSALAEVARRWPLTRAGELAWWSLGDLELELGNVQEAVGAWQRAVAARAGVGPAEAGVPADWPAVLNDLEREDGGEPSGAILRARFAAAALSDGGGLSAELQPREPLLGELRLPGAGEGLGPPPGSEADEWPRPLRLPTSGPFAATGQVHDAFHAVRAGDSVLVSDSMRVISVNAYSGTVQWDSGEAPGWDALDSAREEYFRAIDRESALIAPAAAQSVVVAALQVPFKQEENTQFQRIDIMRTLPDRRLFAWDVKTGAPLWNHMPPPLWDGDSGSFSQRMRVAGPPVIAGSRVLAPMVRMRGRIDYHVGCFRLDTGELLWSANLVSGQRETNMFGRPTQEFSAAPLRVEGDRVIALTQLGTLAALDLYTGEILWQALYDQIPLPKNKHYEATPRPHYWENAPPSVAAGMVIATPFDSEDLIAVDLDTGALAWSLPCGRIRMLAGRDADVDLLIGADETTVYLAGNRIVALEAPSGLEGSVPPTRVRWVFEDEALEESGLHWPVLARDRVVVPTGAARIDVDRVHGKRLGSSPLNHRGNLLLDEGALFVLSDRMLTGYFAWDALLTRARRELDLHPDDPVAALALGRLLFSRGVSEWSDPGDTDRARLYLAEAHELLESFLDRGGDHAAAIAEELHDVLRHEARVRADLADTAGALRVLERARALATQREDLRDTFLEELALLRGRGALGGDGAWDRTLDALVDACGDMTLKCEVRAEDGDGEAPGARFVPLVGTRPSDDSVLVGIPIGLWVAFERVLALEAAGDDARVFEELHAILERYGAVELPHGTAGELAADHVGRLVSSGRTQGYEAFERRAAEHLDRALAAQSRERLEEVARLFPHSAAAREANDALLDWARENSDAETVARIVLDELPETWRLSQATEREIGLALRLASVLGRAGNGELSTALVRRLAASHPETRSPLPEDGGATLEEIAARSGGDAPGAAQAARFDETCRSAAIYEGDHEILGRLPGGVLVVQVDRNAGVGRLRLIDAERPAAPVWMHEVRVSRLPRRWAGRVALAAGRCVLAIEDGVRALDAGTGEPAWSRSMRPDEPELVVAADGVALAVVRRPDDTYAVHAFDARAGTPLWSVDASDPTLQEQPLAAEGRAVFLPSTNHSRLVVRDLFTGKLVHELELPTFVRDPKTTFYEGSWIEGDKLILPWFIAARFPERNHILAVDLELGELAWRLEMPSPDGIPRELRSIVQHDGRTYLVLSTAPGPGRSSTFGEIRELRTNLPAISNPIGDLRLDPDDKLLGVERRERVVLSEPYLFVRSRARDPETAHLGMIHLPFGERWTHALPVPAEDLYTSLMPLPALSESTVAFAYTYTEVHDRRSNRTKPQPPVTRLVFLDRGTGLARETRTLSDELGRKDRLELLPAGRALLVLGRSQLEILR